MIPTMQLGQFGRRVGNVAPSAIPHVSTITVASGTVASDLTSFVVMVHLEDMPSGFWDNVKSDGGDIRVYESDGTTLLPHDVIRVDTLADEGLLFFKRNVATASDTVVKIECGYPARSKLAATDTYGRNAVWSSYEFMVSFDELVDRTGNGHTPALTNAVQGDLYVHSSGAVVTGHQGVAWDGTYYYITDTNYIRKFNSSWTLVASNADPITASGISGVNHCGDPEVVGSYLYVPIEFFPTSAPFTGISHTNQHIAKFNTSDLTFVSEVDISAQGHEASSIAYNTADSLFYVSSYESPCTYVDYYDSSFTYQGTVTLSSSLPFIQGVTFFGGKMYLSAGYTGDQTITRASLTGTIEEIVFTGVPYGIQIEGLSHNIDGVLVFFADTSGIVCEMRTRPPGWLSLGGIDYATLGSVPEFTQWSAGISAIFGVFAGSNRSLFSYLQASDANATRASMVFRNSSTKLGIWNTTDSWLESAATETRGTVVRGVYTHDGTTSRKIYRNGTAATDSSVAQKPSGTTDSFVIGTSGAGTEYFSGIVNYSYLRNGVLSADWLSAEDKSWRQTGVFYTVT